MEAEVRDPVYFVEAHGDNAQAVQFATERGKAVFIVPNRDDHDPSKTVTVHSMAALDAYELAKAFLRHWEGQ